MRKTEVSMRARYIFSKIGGSAKEVSTLIAHLKRYDESEVARERLRIIKFYEKNGEKITKEAFGVDRKIIWVWRQRMQKGLVGLIPDSTAPKRPRRANTCAKIVNYIKALREKYPKLSKKKIKPLLDEFCDKEKLPTVSEATVGRIIKRKNLFFHKTDKVYHYFYHTRYILYRQITGQSFWEYLGDTYPRTR